MIKSMLKLVTKLKRRKKAKKRIVSMEEITKKFIDKLERLKRRGFVSKVNQEDATIQFFHLIREFFSSLFKIKYEFTYEELKQEVNKKRVINKELKKKFLLFIYELERIEYSGTLEKIRNKREFNKRFNKLIDKTEKLTIDFINGIRGELDEDRQLNKESVKTQEKKEKVRNILRKKGSKKRGTRIVGTTRTTKKTTKKTTKTRMTKTSTTRTMPTTKIAHNRKIETLFVLLLKGNEALDNKDIKTAVDYYNKIRKNYERLSEKEKQYVYDDIIELYNRILEYHKK